MIVVVLQAPQFLSPVKPLSYKAKHSNLLTKQYYFTPLASKLLAAINAVALRKPLKVSISVRLAGLLAMKQNSSTPGNYPLEIAKV